MVYLTDYTLQWAYDTSQFWLNIWNTTWEAFAQLFLIVLQALSEQITTLSEFWLNVWNSTWETFTDLFLTTTKSLSEQLALQHRETLEMIEQCNKTQVALILAINETIVANMRRNTIDVIENLDKLNDTLFEYLDEMMDRQDLLQETVDSMLEIMEKFNPGLWLSTYQEITTITGFLNYEGSGTCGLGVCALTGGEVTMEVKILTPEV